MSRLSVLILCGIVLSAGCQTTDTSSESEYNRVSREIERRKAESEAAVTTGDNVKIVVNMLSTDIAEHFAIDSLLRYVDKNIAIAKRPGVFARSGLRIGLAGENFRARLDVAKRQLRSSEETELFIVLADGTTGYIHIGREIAVPRFDYFGRWYSSVGYEFRAASRSLKVTARKLPSGMVDMELTELSTRVVARPGQMLVISGGDTADENVAKALLSYSKYGEKKRTLITVTPHAQ